MLFAFSQKSSLKDNFPIFLKNNNLSFNLPDGFYVPDTINTILPKTISAPIYQINSVDKNVTIYFVYLKYSKKDEEFYKKMNPGKKIDLKSDYLTMIRNIDEKNSLNKSFNENGIKYFNKEELDSIGSDIGGQYSMTLATPFQKDFTNLTIRFIGKYYNFWIYNYFFFKESDAKIFEKIAHQTKYMIKIK
jgi:hypothetical protein